MKKVCILLDEGFEEVEALTVCDIMRRAGVHCDLVSMNNEYVVSSHNVCIKADRKFHDNMEYDMVVLPGGLPGATNLRDDLRVVEFVQKMDKENKLIAAVCASPIVLGRAGLTNGKKITSYPGYEEELPGCTYLEDMVVIDGNIITSRGPATTMKFAYTLLEELGLKEKAESIKKGMLYTKYINK